MAAFQNVVVSCVTDGIIEGSAVGDLQLYSYMAMVEYCRVNDIACAIKTYSAYKGLPAPIGHTLMPCEMGEVLSDLHFQTSDVVFMHYWGGSKNADILSFAPSHARKVVLYYGITRPHLYPEMREYLESGYKQAIFLNEADAILVTSDYIANDVYSLGVDKHKVHKVPLCRQKDFPQYVALREPSRKILQLTFLSRFCSAKGVEQMFEALQKWEDTNWRLNIIFHEQHSDKNLLEKYQALSKKFWKGRVRWHASVDECTKRAILEDTDILLSPSLHEGFAVPLIEALSYGCALVYSDGGSQPEVSGGLGLQFPVNDISAFEQCLDKAAQARRRGEYACSVPSGVLAASKWREHAQTHVDFYSYEHFRECLSDKLFSELTPKNDFLHDLLAERRVAALRSMGITTRSAPAVPQFMLDAINGAMASQVPAPQNAETVQTLVTSPIVPIDLVDTHEQQAMKQAMQQAYEAEAAVCAIYDSLSWRLTAPLRSLVTFADGVKVAVCKKDIVREKAAEEWQRMVSSAETPHDWRCIAQSRKQSVDSLHQSISWKISSPLREAYTLSSKSNVLRRIYALIFNKPYIPHC